jgi:hypothetical protein
MKKRKKTKRKKTTNKSVRNKHCAAEIRRSPRRFFMRVV